MDDALRILIVDDDQDGSLSLRDVLHDMGYPADVAHNGAEALELVRRQTYDIALLDYRMPDIDGVSLYRRIKQLHPAIAGVVITAFATEETHRSAAAAGADQILPKPLEMERLLALIARVSQRPVVLLIDDDQDFCESLRDLLQEKDFRVSMAHSVKDAVSRLALDRCQTAIVDLQLGRESGMDVLERIHAHYQNMNIVVVSGYPEQLHSLHDRFEDLGVEHVISKPLDLRQLLQKLA